MQKQRTGSGVWVVLALTAWSAAAVWFFYSRGWLLYYGDAEAHLNIARRIFDSQTPGYDQIGTGWLPLPHWLMLPFAGVDEWWRSGIAGSISAAACFVAAGAFLFAAVRRVFESAAAAVAATALLALNPNLLYMQSTAMTEAVFLAALMALAYFSVRFRETQGWGAVVGAGIAACAGTLARYEGWFLIPFAALYLLGWPGGGAWAWLWSSALWPRWARSTGWRTTGGCTEIRWSSTGDRIRRGPSKATGRIRGRAIGPRPGSTFAPRPNYAPGRAWR
jgi:hypothetical protein